jgi:catechol 2,3-dioxygenase-like lactoylglutathione lyase family enzyme
VTTLKRASPILPVRDLDVALAFYARLGFGTRKYDEGYGFARRDRVEIHLGRADGDATPAAPHATYLWVDDADAMAREWRAAGVTVAGPEDTAWEQHEGTVVDPDGNVLRFGSPLQHRHLERDE